MGVKELTSYIESLEPPISLQVQAQVTLGVPDLRSSSIPPTETLVIDGWVWLFFHYLRNFPNTVDGGDYLLFDQEINEFFMPGGKFPLLSVLIQVLIANTHLFIPSLRCLSLHFVFIFDGPAEPKKLPTILARREDHCSRNEETIRLTPFHRSVAKVGRLPPRVRSTAITTLKSLDVEIIFAPAEADGLVAEIADKRKGYAVSQDSDFLTFCSKGKGAKGYVPFESLEYVWKVPEDKVDKKQGNSLVSHNPPPIPSSSTPANQHTSLSSVKFQAFSPSSLSAHLG